MFDDDPSNGDFYALELVEETPAPEGSVGELWHRYQIGKGPSRIDGKARGTLFDVTALAQDIVEKLNGRIGKRETMFVKR